MQVSVQGSEDMPSSSRRRPKWEAPRDFATESSEVQLEVLPGKADVWPLRDRKTYHLGSCHMGAHPRSRD